MLKGTVIGGIDSEGGGAWIDRHKCSLMRMEHGSLGRVMPSIVLKSMVLDLLDKLISNCGLANRTVS